MTAADTYEGSVVQYDRTRGYGFIACNAFPSDVFFHTGEVKKANIDARLLLKGAKLQFSIGESRDGRQAAIDLKLIG